MRYLFVISFLISCVDQKYLNEESEPSEEIENTAPSCEITIPACDPFFQEGKAVHFEATVSDVEDARTSLEII